MLHADVVGAGWDGVNGDETGLAAQAKACQGPGPGPGSVRSGSKVDFDFPRLACL